MEDDGRRRKNVNINKEAVNSLSICQILIIIHYIQTHIRFRHGVCPSLHMIVLIRSDRHHAITSNSINNNNPYWPPLSRKCAIMTHPCEFTLFNRRRWWSSPQYQRFVMMSFTSSHTSSALFYNKCMRISDWLALRLYSSTPSQESLSLFIFNYISLHLSYSTNWLKYQHYNQTSLSSGYTVQIDNWVVTKF